MAKLDKESPREIIADFAKAIKDRKDPLTPKPAKTVIDFRNEHIDGREREIVYVPIELLLFRKDNGRISSDVIDYEKMNGPIDEKSTEGQEIIRNFLLEKDKDKTSQLKNSIQHTGQRDPAIITCDGFLINGNRRKLTLELLFNVTKEAKFTRMKVVILPGESDPGGPPTIKEIEQIENRYQLHSDGKAEYSGFDRALSIRRKIECGMTLEEQLKDDPNFANLSPKDFKAVVNKFNSEYLLPLKCADDYLKRLGREEQYGTISGGKDDKEGRWQAFIDYYSRVHKHLQDPKSRAKMGISETEVGKIEDVAYKLIRKRVLKQAGISKLHEAIRCIPKWISNKNAKKELIELIDIEVDLPDAEKKDSNGNYYSLKEIDRMWSAKHASNIINQVKKTKQIADHKAEIETPLKLLEAAYKKLTHDNMDTSALANDDLDTAREMTSNIQKRASELESEIYHHMKNYKKNLSNKFSS